MDPLAASVHCARKLTRIALEGTFQTVLNDDTRHYHIVSHGLRSSGTVIWPRNLLDIQTMTVYITRNNSKTDVYHDNEDCYRLQRAVKVRELEKDHIIIQDKRLCRRCAGNIDRTYTRSNELNETLQKLQEVQGEYKILDNE